MKTTLVVLVAFRLSLLFACSVNFKNNACRRGYLYPIAPFSKQCYENPDVLSDVVGKNTSEMLVLMVFLAHDGKKKRV